MLCRMSFTNQTIDPHSLPTVDTLDWTPMPPEHRREVLVQSLITVAIVALPLLIVVWQVGQGSSIGTARFMLPAIAVLLGLGATRLALIKVGHKGWALREHDLAFRSGLFWRKQVLLPFNRIQHVELASGPLQRRFGVASLKCFTAGGTSVDLKISGLLVDVAERLREYILERSAADDER